jgi:hypothetical protein
VQSAASNQLDLEASIMKIASIVSTKGGPGKTTVTANLGAFCADANIRTLLIDLDTQPSLSSFYRIDHEAAGGTYQLIAQNDTRPEQIISRTCIPNLSLILSNDPYNQLSNLLQTTLPAAVSFRRAATEGIPARRLEYRQPLNRRSPSAFSVIKALAVELFPEWKAQFELLSEQTLNNRRKADQEVAS